MAKQSMKNREQKRQQTVAKYAQKRAALKALVMDREAPVEERFEATLKLAQLPRNGAKVRVRLRCELTGRPRGTFRQFGLGRAKIREIAFAGGIPGVTKSSW